MIHVKLLLDRILAPIWRIKNREMDEVRDSYDKAVSLIKATIKKLAKTWEGAEGHRLHAPAQGVSAQPGAGMPSIC